MKLTREQIDKLEEGPEADAASAEFVMGWSKEFATTKRGPPRRQPAWIGAGGVFMHWEWEWRPTTYIAAALEAADHIHKQVEDSNPPADQGFEFTMHYEDSEYGVWHVQLRGDGVYEAVRLDQLPLAIVKAALLWKLEREESKC